jgi:hypothetical protein
VCVRVCVRVRVRVCVCVCVRVERGGRGGGEGILCRVSTHSLVSVLWLEILDFSVDSVNHRIDVSLMERPSVNHAPTKSVFQPHLSQRCPQVVHRRTRCGARPARTTVEETAETTQGHARVWYVRLSGGVRVGTLTCACVCACWVVKVAVVVQMGAENVWAWWW